MKHLIGLLLFFWTIAALADFPTSGWYIEIDPETEQPADGNSGFNLTLVAEDNFLFSYYGHVERDYIGGSKPPVVSPGIEYPDLTDSIGNPIWYLANADFVAVQDQFVIASGPVRYFPQNFVVSNEIVVGTFFIFWVGTEAELEIEHVENPVFGPSYSLYRDYPIRLLATNINKEMKDE